MYVSRQVLCIVYSLYESFYVLVSPTNETGIHTYMFCLYLGKNHVLYSGYEDLSSVFLWSWFAYTVRARIDDASII